MIMQMKYLIHLLVEYNKKEFQDLYKTWVFKEKLMPCKYCKDQIQSDNFVPEVKIVKGNATLERKVICIK